MSKENNPHDNKSDDRAIFDRLNKMNSAISSVNKADYKDLMYNKDDKSFIDEKAVARLNATNDVVKHGKWGRREHSGRDAAFYGVRHTNSELGTYATKAAAKAATVDDLSVKGSRLDASFGHKLDSVDKRHCFIAHTSEGQNEHYYLCASESADVRDGIRAGIPMQDRIMEVVARDGQLFTSQKTEDGATMLTPVDCDIILEQEVYRTHDFEHEKEKFGIECDDPFNNSDSGTNKYSNHYYDDPYERRRMIPELEPSICPEREIPEIECTSDDSYEPEV